MLEPHCFPRFNGGDRDMRGVAVTEEPAGNSSDSLRTITSFSILGAVNGLLLGLGILVVTCSSMSNLPGRFEALLLAVLFGILTAGGACLGVIVGFVVSLPRRPLQEAEASKRAERKHVKHS
jgi:hypothetical protein